MGTASMRNINDSHHEVLENNCWIGTMSADCTKIFHVEPCVIWFSTGRKERMGSTKLFGGSTQRSEPIDDYNFLGTVASEAR